MATESFQLVISGNLNGQYNESVQTFQGTGLTANDTYTSGLSLNSGWQASLQALWLATLPGSYSLNFLRTRRIITSPSKEVTAIYQAFATVGTRGADATAFNLCPAVQLVPTMGVKSSGRCFMPAVPQGDIVNNSYSAGYNTAVQAYFTAAVAGFTASGINWKLGIFSRKLLSVALVSAHGLSERLGFQSKRRYPGT